MRESDRSLPRGSAGWKKAARGALLGALILAGCNLLAPLATDHTDDLDYDGLIVRGSQAINDGDYAEAVSLFARAKLKNHRGSEAYLFHAKAIMALYSLDYQTLNGEFENKRGDDARGLPFIDSTDSVESVDSVYYPIYESVRDLNHILRGPTDTLWLVAGRVFLGPDADTAGDGRVSPAVAQLDLGLLQTLNGMLAPLDLDGNGRIDRECGRNLCAESEEECMKEAAYRSVCKDGPESEVKRLKSFQALTQNVNLKNLDSKDMNARDVSTNPNDINAFLDAMEGPLAGANFNLDSVNGSLNTHGEADISGELGDVVGNVRDMRNFLAYMRFNDHQDNDFDGQSGLAFGDDIMIWHDFDKDGGIRWDYDEDAPPAGFPPDAVNIGHPVHRYLHPELYLTFEEFKRAHPQTASDTSTNSRTALMKKHCLDVVGDMPVSGEFTADIRDSTARLCDILTPTVKNSVTPPERSDWIGGPFGIDEEMVDERDNDYDGLRDEDGRNAEGMDDDDDATLSVDMLGGEVKPMKWKDDPDHENACPDIDLTEPMPDAPLQREFCVGSIEHRIFLARNGGRDTLLAYYSPFLTEGPSENCLEDYDKLPQAYKDAFKPTEAEIRQACRFKHIWIAPRPPHSEWESGVFGIDEELPDGLDNDGDGWIDEDVQ